MLRTLGFCRVCDDPLRADYGQWEGKIRSFLFTSEARLHLRHAQRGKNKALVHESSNPRAGRFSTGPASWAEGGFRSEELVRVSICRDAGWTRRVC